MSNILQAAPYTSNILIKKECFNTEILKIGSAVRISCDETEEEYNMIIADISLDYVQGYRIAKVTADPVLVEIGLLDYLKGVVTITILEQQREQRIWQE